MDTAFIITSLAPAIMLFFIAMIVKFFPPTRDNNSLTIKVPEWCSRDQKTWNIAYGMLAKSYLRYSLVLAGFC